MATPFEDWLRLQGNSLLPPPRPTPPAPPTFARSPYLTPQQSEMLGLPFGTPLLGTEMPGSAPLTPPTEAAPAPEAAAPTNGFTPASLDLPRPIAKGRGPFDDFLATYNLGRTPPEASPFAGMAQPPSEQQPPFFLSAQPGQQQVRGIGGAGSGMGVSGMDEGQMRREAMLAQRFPRAMARINQLRQMGSRRGY